MNKFHSQDLSISNFLVTGGAGFIGSHIAEYLLKNNAGKVRVIDNLSNGFKTNLDLLQGYKGFEFIEGDIRNIETCRQACEGIHYVSHQAALGSVPRSIKEPYNSNDVNVGGFVNILTAAVENKVQINIKGMLSTNDEAKNKVYNVAVGENYSVNYLYNAIKEYLKSDINAIHRDPREGDIRNSLAAISLAKKLLNYEPTTKFEIGLVKTIEFFKELYLSKKSVN